MNKLVRIVVAVAVTAAVASAGSVARADLGDNTAVVINTHDGSTKFRIAFSIHRVNRDVVDGGNTATAVASCTSCETVAIAIEALIVTADASTIAPTNFAFAYNVDCTDCDTLADAYQYVFLTGGQVRLTADGNRQLAAIRAELQQLRTADLDIDALHARVDALAAQVKDVVTNELVLVGKAP